MKEMMNFHSKELEENIILLSHIIMFMLMFATYFTKDIIEMVWWAKEKNQDKYVSIKI